ncbi:MAG: nucleoside hydrolase, partial [Opitutales bacterium]|nr:nucleoside hydrolase [Opitutales bacterium]
MKRLALLLAALCASLAFAKPQRVIFDTDMGNDVDDIFALTILMGYHASGEADLAAVLVNKDNPYAPVFVSLVQDYYGVKTPIGMVDGGSKTKGEGCFAGAVSKMKNPDGTYKYARSLDPKVKPADAVRLARKILSESEDGSVVYVSVGFSTNVSRLFDSLPDEISPLTGRELVYKKVKYFSVMAAQFATAPDADKIRPEYNVKIDPAAAKNFFETSPVPIIFSGFEIGVSLKFSHDTVDRLFSPENPARVSYDLYALAVNRNKCKRHDRPTWDLTSALYVFQPDLWDLSEPVDISVAESGLVSFKNSPEAKHR